MTKDMEPPKAGTLHRRIGYIEALEARLHLLLELKHGALGQGT
jgi:hypothetical protein